MGIKKPPIGAVIGGLTQASEALILALSRGMDRSASSFAVIAAVAAIGCKLSKLDHFPACDKVKILTTLTGATK